MNVLAFRGSERNSDGELTVAAREHRNALYYYQGNKHAAALRILLVGWQDYADAHLAEFGDSIGRDYVLGSYWAELGMSIKRLLDGPTGGLDCGSLARNITEIVESEGFKTDGYHLLED